LRTRTNEELRVDDDVDAKTWPGDATKTCRRAGAFRSFKRCRPRTWLPQRPQP